MADDETTDNPFNLATFHYGDIRVTVTKYTQTLAEMIHRASRRNTPLAESEIWQVLLDTTSIALTLEPTEKLGPRALHYCGRDFVYYPPRLHTESQRFTNSLSFYDSPEVLARQPGSEYAHSWAIGCTAYEMMALEPAFYDPDVAGNLLEVARRVADGDRPSMQTLLGKYSHDLINLVQQCLKFKAQERPRLVSIITLALERLR